MRLIGVGRKWPVVNAGCGANDAIHVLHAGVQARHLTVNGAAEGFGSYPAEIFYDGVASGAALGLRLINSCDAEYGVSAFDTAPVRIFSNFAEGFTDSGIYIGSITNTQGRPLVVSSNRTLGNARGIIVEDSNLPAVAMNIVDNVMVKNRLPSDEGLASDGLYLTNSNGIRIVHNLADGNNGSGFHPNASSDHNLFSGNVARNNRVGPLLNEGHGNCGSGNSFVIPAR